MLYEMAHVHSVTNLSEMIRLYNTGCMFWTPIITAEFNSQMTFFDNQFIVQVSLQVKMLISFSSFSDEDLQLFFLSLSVDFRLLVRRNEKRGSPG